MVGARSALAETRQINWSPDAAAELIEMLVDTNVRRAVRPAVFVESIQSGTVVLEKETSVKVLRAVLRNCQNLRAGVAAVFGGIDVRNHANFLDGFLVRRNHGRAPVRQAVHAGAVDLIVVCRDALPVRGNLRLILSLKN